jgi:hypothetical protein
MRYGLIAFVVLLLVVFGVLPMSAQTASGSPAGADKAIPALSGIWEAPVDQRNNVCGEAACANLLKQLGEPPPQHDITIVEPQMLPWAAEKYKVARAGLPDAAPTGHEEANPWFSACTPLGPSALMLGFFNAVELRQFPDVVLLFFAGSGGEADHLVRHVYMDGRGHPPDLRPTWMGDSIGHYEGDTLVVDTIGIRSINRSRMVDLEGHPHSDALRLLERFRRVNQNSLEYEVTINDPKAYKNSWVKKIVRQLAPPGPRFWDQAECEELLQMGTHYGAAARQ